MIPRGRALAVFLLCGLSGTGAWAADAQAEFTPFAAYRMGGEFRSGAQDGPTAGRVDTRDGGGWGADVGLYRDAGSYYELLYSRRDARLGAPDPELVGVDLRIEYLQIGGTLLFPQPRGYSGYLSLTLGMTRFGASSGGYDTDHKLSGSIGGGVRFPLAGNLQATFGMRGYVTLVESDNELVCVSAGGEAKCLLRSSGKTFLEAEAHAGLTFRF